MSVLRDHGAGGFVIRGAWRLSLRTDESFGTVLAAGRLRQLKGLKMTDTKDPLPSDTEDGGLKPQKEKTIEAPPPPDDKRVKEDPSEQPS